ncbi:MAG: iron-sulfur cluster assembly accessory protein [Pseudomonadota bacterium]
MLTLTPGAVKAVKRFIEGSTDPMLGLRIAVTGGGCSGLQYGMRLEPSANADDTVVECDGVSILVDPQSVNMLTGVTVDFVDSMEGSGFKFENPNASNSCGCGKSFSA